MKARSVALAAGAGALALLGALLPAGSAGAADPSALVLNLGTVYPRTNVQQATWGWITVPAVTGEPVVWSCTLDGQPIACQSGGPSAPGSGSLTTPAGLAEGPHSISVTTADPRVTATPLTRSWYVDLTAPQVSITSAPTAPVKGPSVFIGVSTVDEGPEDGVSVVCSAPGHMDPLCASGSEVVTTSENDYTFSVTATDAAGNVSNTATTNWIVDRTPPTVTVEQLPALVIGTAVTTQASAADAWLGIDSLQLRTRWAATDSGLGAWEVRLPQPTFGVSASSSKRLGMSGTFGCVSWRATDGARNTSPWSPPTCTSMPVDDPVLGIATSGWKRTTQTGAYLGTVMRTTSKGASLRLRALARQVGVVATTCPTCGTVGVWVGSRYLGKVSLTSSTVKKRQIRWLPAYSSRTATVTIRTLTSGRPVYVDALVFRR